ncbi:MAG TPA: hypothetical protein VI670_04605, partial [Thermoanaerobaculia bacterium]
MKTRFALLLLLVSSVAFGSLENARIVHHASLSQAMSAAGDSWVVYQVPSNGRYVMCCMDWIGHGKTINPKTCRLGQGGSSFTGDDNGHFDNIDRSTMLVALHGGRVETYSGGCPVDAGGATVHVADDVSAVESLNMLEARVGGRNDRHRGALAAIAMHGSPRVAQILERFSTQGSDPDLRGDAIFWFAQAGGRRGFEVARKMANDDPDERIRKKAVFALT